VNRDQLSLVIDAVSARAQHLERQARRFRAARNEPLAEDRQRHANRIWEVYDSLLLAYLGVSEKPVPRLTEAQYRERAAN
jgi:hypothetical protein